MDGLADRLAYAASQAARVAFFAGQYALARRLATPSLDAEARRQAASLPTPGRRRMRQEMLALFARDLANVEAGLYPSPPSLPRRPLTLLRTVRAFFADLPRVDARRRRGASSEVAGEAPQGAYPRYYLQNFHFQSGGWLSEESAALYDHQVDVLFSGTADAMRRQGLVPLKRRFGGQRRPRPRIADIGAGTGRFLAQLGRALPQARLYGVEPSPAYCRRAGARLPSARIVRGYAEALPFDDAALDAATAVYLFHELPPGIRRRAAAEIGRVLRPGGLFVMVDSLQTGDRREFDGLLELFPMRFHEPYYASYLSQDFEALFAPHGLRLIETDIAFLSRIFVFERSERAWSGAPRLISMAR